METKKTERRAKKEVAAISHKIVDGSGKEVGTIELPGAVFGQKAKPSLVHAVVRWQLAKRRAGTHQTLTRSMMKGGGKKPFKQKGTGNARAGSIISPLWVGGAVVHGPQPRDYEHALPRKLKRQVLCGVLSSKLAAGKFMILNDAKLKAPKTSEVAGMLKKLGLDGKKVLWLTGSEAQEKSFEKAARNIAGLSLLAAAGVNVYDLMRHDVVVGTKQVVENLQQTLSA